MPSILLSGPAVEPISLAEAKLYLRIQHSDDDDLIAALIAGSRIHVESQTRRALIAQSWRLTRDAWPESGCVFVLPVPLVSLAAARVYTSETATQALDLSVFMVDKAPAPALVAFAPGALPAPARAKAGIEIDVTVGYGASPANVPEPLRLAIRLLTAHWYENRAIAADGREAVPAAIAALIAPYRVLSL